MKKLFTLIELIVVIVVIGILAAIVIPNISSFKEEAKIASIESNGKNIQTALDMFKLKEGELPTFDGKNALIGSPKQVDFSKLKPEHLRSTPKNGFYWVDYTGGIIYSDTDTPLGVENNNGSLTWEKPKAGEAVGYKVYGVGEKTTGSAKQNQVVFIAESETNTYTLKEEEKGYKDYLVASVSRNGFVSPGISQDTIYTGIDLSELPDGNVESGEDSPPEPEIVPEPVKKTPTTFGSVLSLDGLKNRSGSGYFNIFAVGDNTEVFYSSEGCCVSDGIIVDTFDSAGVRTDSKTIKNYKGSALRSISNLDEEGNRYVFTENGDLHIIKPDNTAELLVNMKTILSLGSTTPKKVGIEVEGDIAYLAYVASKPYLAIYNMKTKQLISKVQVSSSYISGNDETNVVVTEDFVYTSMLNNYADSNSDIYIFKWDKQTGKSLGMFLYDTPYSKYNPPTMFLDTNGGLWFTETRRSINDNVSIKVNRVNATTFNGIDKTVELPDLKGFPSASDSAVKGDGSIQFYYQAYSTFKSISFQ